MQVKNFLQKLYDKILCWSRHPQAPWYLSLVSFLDSSVFPISPLCMLIPMCYAVPQRAFFYAGITTLSSILGGMVGYALGLFAFQQFMQPFIQFLGYESQYLNALDWFHQWGSLTLFISCFIPLPFKVFTIGAGVLQLPFFEFCMASGLGRVIRFYVVSALVYWGGPRIEPVLRRVIAR